MTRSIALDFVVVYVDAIGNQSAHQFFRVNTAGPAADGIHTATDDSGLRARLRLRRHRPADASGFTPRLLPIVPHRSPRCASPGDGPPAWRAMVSRRVLTGAYMYTSVLGAP